MIFCSDIPNPQFLFFSDSVPGLLYYSHIPAVIVSLLIGIFVFVRARNLVGTILVSISIVFSLWSFLSLIAWTNNNVSLIQFIWPAFGVLYSLLYALCLYFVYVYIDKKDISFNTKLIISILLLPVILFASSKWNLQYFDLTNCEVHEGHYFTSYYYLLGLIFMLWTFGVIVMRYRKAKPALRKQIVPLGVGMLLFLLSFFVTGYLASAIDNFELEQYGLFGMLIFMGFLAYLIVQFKAFNIKLLATQALVMGLVILIASQFFFVRNPVNIVLTGITLIIAIGFGYMLVKSVKGEVTQRERIELLAGDLAKANDSLFAANLKLKELDRQKTEFVSIASHQLRSPLTAIKGYVSMILEGSYGEVGEKMHQPLQNIFDSSQRLVVVIEDFLNVTRIELGRMKYEFSNLNVRDLVEKVVSTMKVSAEQKGLTLNFIAEEGEYEITADPGKLSQVISNLVDNAIKYTPTGSIEVKVSDGEAKVRIAIKDSGVGLTPEVMPKLFEKFVRADDAGKVNYSGTGLGLYVAKQMVEAHKGKIWAESAGTGTGSTFIVELPAKKG